MKRINICSFIIVLALFMLIGCGVKKIKMPFSDSDAKTMQYTEVIEQLSNAGFSNVESSSTPTNKENQDGLVKKVTIYVTQRFPTDFFSKGSSYAYDTRIEVVYYTYEVPAAAEEQNSQTSESKEASTENSSEAPADSNESSKSFEPEPLNVSEDEYLEIVKERINDCIGQFEKYGDLTLNDRILIIPVKMGTDSDYAPLSAEDMAEGRISDITDALLVLDDSYWDKVILDFGKIGTFTGEKADIINGEYGRYFDMPFLDKNKELYTQDTTSSSEPLTTLQMSYAWAIAKNECDKYLSGVTYPKADYIAVKFDKNGAIMVTSEQLEFKTRDEKQPLLFVFTPDKEDFDLLSNITVHFLSAGNKVYVDDGYCDDFFSTLSQIGN